MDVTNKGIHNQKNIDVINRKWFSDVEHKRLKEEEIQLLSDGKNLQEELTKVTKMLKEESTRLAVAINNRKFDAAATAEVLVTVANAKLAILKTQFIENNETVNWLQKKWIIQINIIWTLFFLFCWRYSTNIFR